MIHLLALIPVAVIYAVFTQPALREARLSAILPYSSLLFFVLFTCVCVLMYAFKDGLAKRLSYAALLFALNLAYFILLFPQPVHALLFAAYFYIFYYLVKESPRRMWIPEALFFTLLPMVVARSTREIQFVGLSYITFRAYHLIADAPFTERVAPKNYFTFLMFFPALLAGPIDRWQSFGAQLKNGYEGLTAERLSTGYRLVLLGACMKFVLGEWLQKYFLVEGWSKPALYFAEFYGYSLNLYFDFAGYSLMAIGAGLMLGLQLPENFNRPYLSRNPQDFWRRFHITLGTWLTDYFFKPIYKALHGLPGLSQRPLLKQNTAIFFTFVLMGCWNGLKAHYLISGALFGSYSVVYNSWVYWCKTRGRTPQLMGGSGIGRWAAIFLTVNACCLALYIFGGRMELFR